MADEAALAVVKESLDGRVRVSLSDGRVLVGSRLRFVRLLLPTALVP
jgi:small nuclear ribonucleoprotein (snRNP)-like protein